MPKKIDLSNTETEYFKILTPSENIKKRTYWNCICKRCGNECVVSTDELRKKEPSKKSCGCLRKDKITQRNKKNIKDKTGKRYGLLTCISHKGSLRNHAAWLCKCDCGNKIITDSGSLEAGYIVSCGCLKTSSGEKIIEDILKNNKIKYKKEIKFDNLLSKNNIPLRFDFGIYDNEKLVRVVEYDGEQHFLEKADKIFSDTLNSRKEKDKLKNIYCLKNKIPLIRIPYWEKKNITLEMLLNNDNYLVKGESYYE